MLAWSPEQPTLFPAPLRANLCVGTPHAADWQITDLLRQLRLGPWLDRWNRASERCSRPGTTRPRVESCSASAWPGPCWPAAVLLLGEPTRPLDAATADAVLHAVLERAADRSLLWITHRPEELASLRRFAASARTC